MGDFKWSNELLIQTLDFHPNYIFVKDDQCRIVYGNKAFMSLHSEENRDKVIGFTTVENYNKKEAEHFLAEDRKCLKEGYTESEFTISMPRGNHKTLLAKKTRVEIDGDLFILAIATDVTPLKKIGLELAERTGYLELTERTARVGHWRVDLKNEKVYWSDETYRIHKKEKQTFTPNLETGINFYHPDDRPKVRAALDKCINQEGSFEFKLRLLLNNNETVYVHSSGKVIKDDSGSPVELFGIFKDITKEVLAEQKILKSNKELESLAHVASHDLKQPARQVASFLSLLKEDFWKDLPENARGYVEHAEGAAKRMVQLVDDILDYSKLGVATQGAEQVDVGKLVENILQDLEQEISLTEATITCSGLPVIKGFQIRLSRLFQNLIGNALKYRSKDRKPVISVSAREREIDWLFSVSDNGIGIASKYLDSIFILFTRLHGRIEYPGSGIGLAACRQIVEQWGGQIWAESVEGEGSTFYFTVPKC